MAEGIGKALASAIKDEAVPFAERGGRHIFQNQHRREIFSKITLTPCIGVVKLASELGIAQNTVEWHLGILIKSGYLIRHDVGRQRVYYPDGLINHELAGLFHTINQHKQGKIFRNVLKTPGLSQTDVMSMSNEGRQAVSNALAKLEENGLITRVADGAHARFYPTRLLPEHAENFYKHAKDFSDYILKKLEQEGGKPPVIIKKGLERIIIEAGYASDRFTIDIGINPYITCIVC